MGALNIQLDQKTKDMLVRMRVEDEGPDLHRRRTMEDVANLAINNQIQMILPPDGDGAPLGGGLQGDIFCNNSELFSIHPILTVNNLPQSEMTARYLFSNKFSHI